MVSDARPQITRLCLDQARALVLRDGTSPAAVRLLTQAQADAQILGMAPIVSEAARLLPRAGGR